MEELLQESRKTLASDSVHVAPEIAHPRFNSLETWILQKVRHLLLNLCNAYFWLRGFREIQLPSITVILPVADRTDGLCQTIRSLLVAQYKELYISVVWLKKREESLELELEHPNIRFYAAKPGITRAQAIREILVRATTPLFAWLQAGDTVTPNVLGQVGKLFQESPKLAGVLVPEQQCSLGRAVTKSMDFSFLWTQSFSFGVKLFARRECLWGAEVAFVGTDYDCNDWAVALSSSRFLKIKMVSDGFWVAGPATPEPTCMECDQIRQKISAAMWWTERFRRSFMQQVVRIVTPLFEWEWEGQSKPATSSSTQVCCLLRDSGESPVRCALTESLLGFSAGVESEFGGSYQWCYAGREPIARKVFRCRKTGTLLFEPITISGFEEVKDQITRILVGPTQEKSALLRAKGVANVITALPKALRAQGDRKVRSAPLAVRTHIPPAVVLAKFDHAIEPRSSTAAPTPPTEEKGADSLIIEELFDILVLEQSLDSIQKPLAVFRKAANYLKSNGWLIIGCMTYVTDPFADGQRPMPILSTDCKMLFSQGALIDLVRVAGFETRRLIGLSEKRLELFGRNAAEALDWVRVVGPTLFQAAEDRISIENYVLLACQRQF